VRRRGKRLQVWRGLRLRERVPLRQRVRMWLRRLIYRRLHSLRRRVRKLLGVVAVFRPVDLALLVAGQ
jgi:hypothetical protein